MMDACCNEELTDVTFMTSSQVGKTEIINNVLGYHIDQDPCPVMIVLPTIDIGRAYSKDRLDPMIRDTPDLTLKVAKDRSRKKDNTVLHKSFPGGHVTISGANSPASLSSRPIRVVLCDEVDRYPYSAGEEGDPEKLAFKRTQTFFNKKRIDTSTPTIKGMSRIEARYKQGDQRIYMVPCHLCEKVQELVWRQIKFRDKNKNPVEPYYECEHCGGAWNETEKRNNVARAQDVPGGGWVPTNPGVKHHASFHIWEIYSPWSSMEEIVASFLETKDNPLTLQTFVNTVLGQTWEETGETVNSHKLMNRRERYTAEVPKGVLLLTAGIDIQKNRIEGEVIGWGRGEECWGIDKFTIMGDTDGEIVWQDLADKLESTYTHESGHLLKVAATGIDSGHQTDTVYAFCAIRAARRVWAMKGMGGNDRPIVSAPTRKKTSIPNVPVDLYIVGADQAKSTIYSRLRITEAGPGYCHFPMSYTEEYFTGLTSEKAMTVYTKGFPKTVWTKPAGKPNEPLDIRVYAYAALTVLHPVWTALEKRLQSELPKAEGKADESESREQPKRKRRRRKRSGFVGGFN